MAFRAPVCPAGGVCLCEDMGVSQDMSEGKCQCQQPSPRWFKE